MNPSNRLLAFLVLAGALGLPAEVSAVPTLYSYDDTGVDGGPFAGTGVFRLDLAPPLGEYLATDAAGSGSSFGPWAAVAFRATPGGFSSLVISNLAGASIQFSLPGIGGGEIQADSAADLEWANFRKRAGGLGLKISAATVPMRDEVATLMVFGLGVGGVLTARRMSAPR